MLKDVLAGLVCGLLMGSVYLAALIYILYTDRDLYDRLRKRLPPGIPPLSIMLALVVGLPLAWCSIGAIAGALYNVAIDSAAGSGLGSSNQLFTLVIIGLTALLMLPALLLIIKRNKWGWPFFATNIVFLSIFGWVLPLLGNWR
jgi:hypothetical protein